MKIPVFGLTRTSLFLNALMILTVAVSATYVSAQKVESPQPEAASTDQCHNGAFGGAVQPCEFVNGNSHGGNSQWSEGQFIVYRVVNSDFNAGTIGATMLLQYDTTVSSGKHAIDYLGWYNYSQTNGITPGSTVPNGSINEGNNPCDPLATCPGTPDFDIFPTDLNVANGQNGVPGGGDDITQIAGGLTTWGCTVTSIGPAVRYDGTYANASSTQHLVTFNVGPSGTCYFAWGGHISSRLDWGANNSAVAVNGSPYHMRINGGADRQLKVEAQGFPAKLTIIKAVSSVFTGNVSNTLFSFDPSFAGPNFTLQDNGTDADGFSDRITFDFPLGLGGTTTASVTELAAGNGWSILDIGCVDSNGGLGTTANSVPQVGAYTSGSTATANMQEAEFVTCTFLNGQVQPTAAPAIVSGRVVNAAGRGISGVTMELINLQTNELVSVRTNTFGYYTFEDVETSVFYSLSAVAKRYSFSEATRYFTLNEDTFNMNFYSAN